MPDEVALVPIDAGNWRSALDVLVDDDQLRFVAEHQPVALVILAKTALAPDGRRWTPLAIERRGVGIVGVVALADRDGEAVIMHLAVDRRRQRQGVGSSALRQLVAYSRELGCSRVWLTVHPENTGAQRLYRAAGFAPTGGERGGEPVWQLDLAPLPGAAPA